MKLLSLILSFFILPFSAMANDASVAKDYEKAMQNQVNSYEEYLKQIAAFEASDKFRPALLEEELPMDINIGDPKAPVKIVEYASLSCIHCKQFHKEVFYNLKKNYIDTGKVYFKYRHYPLNAPAAKAALIVNCVSEENKQSVMGSLFEGQAQWAYSKSESDVKDKLSTVAKIAGLSTEDFNRCYSDEAQQNVLIDNMKKAYDQLFISSTPSIFIQKKRFMESREYEGVAKYIDDIIAGKKPEAAAKDAEKEAEKKEEPKSETPAPAAPEESKKQ